MRRYRLPALLISVVTLSACASRTPSPATTPPPAAAPAASPAEGQQQRRTGPRPFRQVVPATARVDSGLFTIHRTDDKLFFQIPDSLLGREMLLVSRIARVPSNLGGFIPAGYSAQEQVLIWSREGNRILLRKRTYEQVAPDTTPIALSVAANNFEPILAAFDVAAIGGDSASAVVDVTDFYSGDTPAISGLSQAQRRDYGVRRLDATRSFINYARSFPLNTDVRHTLTFDAATPPSNASTSTLSLEMHQSLILLPREPMRPRYADARVGWFTVRRVNFGLDAQKAGTQTFLRRWRLEPSDPAAYARGELVTPVKPITYYLDPATPLEYSSCVRQGVQDWRPAFETAGFRNAIVALDPPSPEQDPEWDPEDARYSVVRWAASLTRNAQGPSTSDPRTGEIIESDIVWYHNHLRSYRNRIMIETGAANPLARSLPIDGRIMCEAVRQVIAHEIGHALGLPHNMIASSSFPVDSLRSKSFASRMGVSPSIMDYARQNYVAQPGDGLEGADFIRRIGPYDHYAINWGYRVLPQAATPEAERPTLNRWILDKAADPMYRYLPQGTGPDPRSQTEDIGDDPVAASGYAIANLKRVLPNLVAWTTRPGEDYTELEEIYGELIGMWQTYVGHVVTPIGGVLVNLKTAEQPGAVYGAVDRARQERSLAFLATHVFEAPIWLLEPDIIVRVGDVGPETIQQRQATVIRQLLDANRLGRLARHQTLDPRRAWPLPDYLDALKDAVWRDPAVTAGDPYRRALQRNYIDRLAALLEDPATPATASGGPAAANRANTAMSDIRPLARAQLVDLRAAASRAARGGRDRLARAHLLDVIERIDAVLEK